jgi:RalBP1-associated Eps domain-containing protein
VTTIRLDSQPPIPQPRSNLSNTLLGSTASGSQRTSAFEVYRKPSSKSRNSQSPPQVPQVESKSAEYEKQVLAISDSLRQVRFKNSEQSSHDVLKHLKDQNVLLMRLCKDLSEELMGVQRKKEEFRSKIDK